jgi:hypothetical protein
VSSRSGSEKGTVIIHKQGCDLYTNRKLINDTAVAVFEINPFEVSKNAQCKH